MDLSLNDPWSSEIRINEADEEEGKKVPQWVQISHQNAVEALERMRHDTAAVGDKENFLSLAAEFQFGSSDIGHKIELLGDDYDSFRQVRRDGDGLYRSFLFSFLERLRGKHLSASVDECLRVFSILEKYKQMNAALGGRRDTFDDVFQEFKCLMINVIGEPPRDSSAEKYLLDCLDEQNALNGVILLRLVTSVEIHMRIDYYSPMISAYKEYASVEEFVVERPNVSDILTDVIRLRALSKALNVPVQVVQLDAARRVATIAGLHTHMFNCSSSSSSSRCGTGMDVDDGDYVVTVRTPRPPAPVPSSGLSDMKGLAAALDNCGGDGNYRGCGSSDRTGDRHVVLMYWQGRYGVLYPKSDDAAATAAMTATWMLYSPAESPPSEFEPHYLT